MKRINFWLFMAILFPLIISCNHNGSKSVTHEIIIFHAGSLAVPFKKLKADFEENHPGTRVVLEAAGSIACARKITDLHRDCDIMASSDYSVIEKFLIPDFTDSAIQFATNELVLAYSPESQMADEINASNWPEILLNEEVLFGRSDPNSDPCGYRTLLMFQLAEKYYKKDSLAMKLSSKNKEYIRPKESDLIALIQSHNLDYAFEYKSVAVQTGLSNIPFPDSINLKNPGLAAFYQHAAVEINGKKPGEKIVRKGAPIVYGICVLHNAPEKKLANQFLAFVLSAKGKKILEENGQGVLSF